MISVIITSGLSVIILLIASSPLAQAITSNPSLLA
jgi:hypothetical protein